MVLFPLVINSTAFPFLTFIVPLFMNFMGCVLPVLAKKTAEVLGESTVIDEFPFKVAVVLPFVLPFTPKM